MASVFDFSATSLAGAAVDLKQFQGKVLLIVNTASECGFTPQYQELQQLHQQFHARGLEVLGFPCNQFGKQEPGSEQEIGAFCEANYGVRFPLFAKIDVNGANAHPLYRYLKDAAPGLLGSKSIKWNFTKFLISRDGSVYRRYAPRITPQALIDDIEKLLVQPAPHYA
jgi:glutathione peroxidase